MNTPAQKPPRASQYHSGFQMAAVINPVNGHRGQLLADGKQVKNHMALNRQVIKQKEEEVK